MEFHVALSPRRGPGDTIDVVQEAAALGFDRFWLADQTFHADPFVMLNALTHVTAMPLGLGVTNPFARHPVQVARAVSTLCHLAPERDWLVGLGTANPQHVLAPLGIELRHPANQLASAVEAIRSLLRGESVTCEESDLDFKMRDVALEIDPVTNVMLYIGTRGPRVLEAAGAVADGVLVEALFTSEGIRWARDLLDAGSRAGRNAAFDRPYVAWQVTEVCSSDEEISANSRAFAVFLMASTARATLRHLEVPEAVIKMVKNQAQPDWRRVPIAEIQKFVCAGSPEAIGDRILQARDAGVTAWTLVLPPPDGVGMMRRFAREVMSVLRGV
jgi:5,10-methylenetetrahydromethanopterin reductase